MNKCMIAVCSVVYSCFAAFADVAMVGNPPTIDGRLDKPCWTDAQWNGPFAKLANQIANREVAAQTAFAVLADARTLYVAVKCEEPHMEKLKAAIPPSIWHSDHIEVFLSPRGDGFDYYQFAVPFSERINACALYASEGGNIHPDPYGPDWKFAVEECDGGWCVEMAIPLSSLYMTRNAEWRDTWKVNVARQRGAGGVTELTTWSPLQTRFGEPENFLAMRGFPARLAADDVAMTDVVAETDGRRDGKIAGTLSFTATVEEGGDYEVASPFAETTPVRLAAGANAVRVPCAYPANGRHETRIELTRKATGETYGRTCPVVVDFEEIRLSLTSPEYRGNFYPGQDAGRVAGRVQCSGSGEVAVTLEGPGFPKREARLPAGGGEFDFDTRGFEDGTATLAVEAGGVRRKFPIRKLAPTGRRMTWISRGRLVVDGKPVLRRGIYATGYMGGKAFAERYAADDRLFLTPEANGSGGTVEPERVIKGIEAREAHEDVVPCKEYFDKIDATIEKSKEKDFAYWYICDEPECRNISPVYLKHIYEHLKEKDPYHVVLMASRGGKKYIDCADWFETHPYLNPRDDGRGNRVLDIPPARIGAYLDAFEAWNRPDKCIGFLPTMFTYRFTSLLNDYPTFPEYVCHVWAAMLRGGKTLWPFYYGGMGDRAALYEGNRYVNSTFAALEDFILEGKRTTLLKTPDGECARWDLPNGESMFALANFTNERKTFEVAGLDGRFRPFRSNKALPTTTPPPTPTPTPSPTPTPTPTPTPLTFTLSPYEVVVGTTGGRGADLPTYAETLAIVEAAEAERTGRDNQLLGKERSLGFASSNGKTRFYKLVDGTRDVLGWSAKEKEPWVEFSFAEGPVSFSRLRVYGSGLENMAVSIRRDGEWKTLEPKTVQTEKYMRELDFGETATTVRIRLSFPAEKGVSIVELYEVEVPHGDGGASTPCEPTAACEPPVPTETSALWSFDASNADWSDAYSTTAWYCRGRKAAVAPREDGGFTVSGTATHAVWFNPEYPWVELEADSFATGTNRAYRAWSLRLVDGPCLFATVTHPQPGHYVARLPREEKPRRGYVRFDAYNLDVGIRRLRCVREPENSVEAGTADGEGAIRPGSVLEVTLHLAAPCEDATASLLIDRAKGGGFEGFPVNGTNAVALEAVDETRRAWRASIPVKTCGEAAARKVYVKCAVLGGSLKAPLFGTIDQPFEH